MLRVAILFSMVCCSYAAKGGEAALDYLVGVWQPGTRAWEVNGPITITKDRVSWGKCRPVSYSIVSNDERASYLGDPFSSQNPGPWRVITIKLAESKCFLMRQYPYLQFAFRPDSQKAAAVVFYESPERFAAGYSGWSSYSKK